MTNRTLPSHWIGARKGAPDTPEWPWDQLISLPPDQMKTHALVIGATGSGKTNLLHHLIAQDILEDHSFVVVDMRGDLVEAALSLCSTHVKPERLKVIDLRANHPSNGFNPLFGAGEPYFRALNVLDVIENESESWGVQLGETLRNALMILTEAGEPLTRLESLFYDRAFLMLCMQQCSAEQVTSFWQRFDSLSADKQAALASPVLNKVSLLFASKKLQSILSDEHPIDLAHHLNRPGSVTLVSLAVDELHGVARMMAQMVLSSICREVFARVSLPERRRCPLRIYVDEFENFNDHEFESLLAEGRRFRASLVLAHQTLAQLSSKMRSMMLNNVGVKIGFRCGREDSLTLSKDFSGDAHRLDFTVRPVGEALLWRRGEEPLAVEINEPLVHDLESEHESILRFTKAVVRGGRQGASQSSPRFEASQRPSPSEGHDTRSNGNGLEDWLCD